MRDETHDRVTLTMARFNLLILDFLRLRVNNWIQNNFGKAMRDDSPENSNLLPLNRSHKRNNDIHES